MWSGTVLAEYVTSRLHRLIAGEISQHGRYSDVCVQLYRRPDDHGELLDFIDCKRKEELTDASMLPPQGENERMIVLLNGVFNFHLDIEALLRQIRSKLSRHTRVLVVAYSPYLRFLFTLANALGLRSADIPTTFLTRTDVLDLARLSGFEMTRIRSAGFLIGTLPLIGGLLERLCRCLPLIRHLALTNIVTLRPVIPETDYPSLSVVIPARNEKGNMEQAIVRLRDAGLPCSEIVFVEGHSNDGTREEIERLMATYRNAFPMRMLRQTGIGKADAVRLGFANCTGTLVAVLDADLTMPPELLSRFYEAYRAGLADFVNGSRLLYPMEDAAMRGLNRMGNVFFAKILSYVLDVRLSDSLCGTKLAPRRDYERFGQWRADFGDFDPFGDFEILFPAAIFALGIVDVPIRYRARTYGSTNIRRFSDGWQLLKMAFVGFFRVKLG
jgi:hypothetical protein